MCDKAPVPRRGDFRIVGQRRIGRQTFKDPIDHVDHHLARTPAGAEKLVAHVGQLGLGGVEYLRHTAAPAIDRLLHVADRKEAASPGPLAASGRQRTQHSPLRQGRVLKLVDQQMRDRTVESPGGVFPNALFERVGQQPRHVAEQQPGPLVFDPPILLGKRPQQLERRLGLIDDLADQHPGGMVEQRLIKLCQVRLDRLAIEETVLPPRPWPAPCR